MHFVLKNISLYDIFEQANPYHYDEACQLTRVDDAVQNKTFVYIYNNGGNITSKVRYAYTTGTNLGTAELTTNYTYGSSNWEDKLTAYGGLPLTYDAIGNLTAFDGKTYTWTAGRQLAELEISALQYTIDYKYNADGLRTQKTINDNENYITTTYDYVWADGNLVSQTDGTDVLYFVYDDNGSPVAFTVNDSDTYLYIKSLQGDITGIADENGAIIVNYAYDAWGKLISTTGSAASTIGVLNPLRYRGYYYDNEVGLYYLQSRYYNPTLCRFINADVYCDTGTGIVSTNMFAYCGNNSLNYNDYDGYFKKEWHKSVTFEIANRTIKEAYANKMAEGSESVDKETPAFSIFNTNWVNWQKWHFNVNSTGDDSRDVLTSQKIQDAYGKLSLAQGYLNSNDLENTKDSLRAAFVLFGKGLHCQQDKITHNEKTTKVAYLYIMSGISYTLVKYYFHFPSADKPNTEYLNSGYTMDEVGRAVTETYVLMVYLKIKNSYPNLLEYVYR